MPTCAAGVAAPVTLAEGAWRIGAAGGVTGVGWDDGAVTRGGATGGGTDDAGSGTRVAGGTVGRSGAVAGGTGAGAIGAGTTGGGAGGLAGAAAVAGVCAGGRGTGCTSAVSRRSCTSRSVKPSISRCCLRTICSRSARRARVFRDEIHVMIGSRNGIAAITPAMSRKSSTPPPIGYRH